MSNSILDQCREDFPLLLETGFIAVNQADEQCAINLFQASIKLNPESSAPHIGFGYIALHKLEMSAAIKHFSKAIELEPENEMVKALLGFCHIMTEKDEEMKIGSEMLSNIAEASKDTDIEELKNSSKHVVNYINDNKIATPFDL